MRPALKEANAVTAISNGAVLGATAYGTFAITNLAVLQQWSIMLTIVDTLWGGFVTAVIALLGYQVSK